MNKEIQGFIKEYTYKIQTQSLSFLHQSPPPEWTENKTAKQILFIYGFDGYWQQAEAISNRFVPKGFSIYCPTDLKNNTMRMAESLAIVKNYILEQGLANFVVIGHSKGGLIAYNLMKDREISPKISKVITISTPFYGLPQLFYAMPGIKDSIPAIDDSLESKAKAKFTNIYSEFDTALLTQSSLKLTGAHNIKLPYYGHAWFLEDPALLELLEQTL